MQQNSNYSEDFTFTKGNQIYPERNGFNDAQEAPYKMRDYVLKNCEKGNPKSCYDGIDKFCEENWMMNLGPEKGKIIDKIFQERKPLNILEVGGYCGYSSLVFAHYAPKAKVHTVEISEEYSKIAREVQQFAGVADRCHITVGVVENVGKEIKQHGPYDAVFLDHAKGYYLSDFKKLESYGVIVKDTIVMGDNIIYPGVPDYLAYFKESKEYQSVLYHSFLEYSNNVDALLVSRKL